MVKSMKFEYGDELKWVIPYPGDWHLLKNYQIALMKPYYDAGLKSLAQSAGYPEAAIKSCSQFKRTHTFLLETWEAVYRVMLTKFHNKCVDSVNLLDEIIESLLSISEENFKTLFSTVLTSNNRAVHENYTEFKHFIQLQANNDDTWKFWIQFVFQDAMAYICLYLHVAIRSGNWHL